MCYTHLLTSAILVKFIDKTVISIGLLAFNSQESLRSPSLREANYAIAMGCDEATSSTTI